MLGDMLKIVFLDRDTLSPETVLRTPSFAHELVVHDRTRAEQVAGRIAEADIVITNKAPLGADAIAAAPRLKMIAVAATGYDMIDVAAARAKGIVVSNIRNYAINTVPEHTFALVLALRRSLVAYSLSVWDGAWKRANQFCYFDYPIRDLSGSTLGIIGDGVLGKAVAEVARGFGMKVLFSSYKGVEGMGPLYTPFERVIAESDVITLHCPLMPSTRNLIGAAELRAMKRSALLINTARGGLVDEAALCDALEAGEIAGAGFDVVTTEPLPDDHPFWRLAGKPNFILTPHVAWASREAIQGLADQLIDNIEGFVQGRPRNTV
jgi:glycerate dehydrogenase